MATVLIIDDDTRNHLFARMTLEDEGHRVVLSSCGSDGLAAFDADRADLVLLDIGLPDMSGLDVIRQLLGKPLAARTRVIAMTASTMPSERQQLVDAGFDDFLFKPYTYDELAGVVRDVLARQS